MTSSIEVKTLDDMSTATLNKIVEYLDMSGDTQFIGKQKQPEKNTRTNEFELNPAKWFRCVGLISVRLSENNRQPHREWHIPQERHSLGGATNNRSAQEQPGDGATLLLVFVLAQSS